MSAVACVEGACRPLKQAGVDTVILGCTHYPLVRPVLQRELGPRGRDRQLRRGDRATRSSRGCVRPTRRATRTRRGNYSFLCDRRPEEFRRVGIRFLQLPIGAVEHVDVAAAGRRAA